MKVHLHQVGLMFASRITAVGKSAGVEFVGADEADLVIAELEKADLEALRKLKAARPAVRIVGFASHVREDLLQAATDAGLDVMSKGGFTQQLASLLGG